ncbi:hypothetical protein [Chromobacterium subtsugae]|uniref:hypothetical protein n=1 Tax=Chromobacterium subtsugae TaxID=251747 RepID=UPI00128BD004|nr:hypothetical protein [Chromobacterium subtsugae]
MRTVSPRGKTAAIQNGSYAFAGRHDPVVNQLLLQLSKASAPSNENAAMLIPRRKTRQPPDDIAILRRNRPAGSKLPQAAAPPLSAKNFIPQLHYARNKKPNRHGKFL